MRRFARHFLAVFCVFVVAIAVLLAPARANIRRTAGSWLFGPQPVFSDGSGSDLFHPMSDSIASVGVLSVRVAYEMVADTGYCTTYYSFGSTRSDAMQTSAAPAHWLCGRSSRAFFHGPL